MKKLINTHFGLIFFILFFLGCSSKEGDLKKSTQTVFSGNIMTIDYKIIVGSILQNEQNETIQKIIQDTFEEVNSIYNKWNLKSEISKLNQMKKGTTVKISEKLEFLLHETNKMVLLAKGRFDPTIEPLQKLWKIQLTQGITPSDHEVERVKLAVGWDKIHVQNGNFYKDHDETSLDLGGIAKGYTVDLLVDRLNYAGYPNVFVEWGGEIKATGLHPENRPWHIFISRLEDSNPDHAIAHIDLKNQAIATSGDYLQNWTVKKNQEFITYFHVIDPKTGMPLEIKQNSIASASVVADKCWIADAIATTLMLFPDVNEASTWAESIRSEYPEVECWIISR